MALAMAGFTINDGHTFSGADASGLRVVGYRVLSTGTDSPAVCRDCGCLAGHAPFGDRGRCALSG